MAKEYLKILLERQQLEQTNSKIILPQSFVGKVRKREKSDGTHGHKIFSEK